MKPLFPSATPYRPPEDKGGGPDASKKYFGDAIKRTQNMFLLISRPQTTLQFVAQRKLDFYKQIHGIIVFASGSGIIFSHLENIGNGFTRNKAGKIRYVCPALADTA